MAARLPVTCCPIGNFKITTLPCFPDDFRDIISGKGAWMLWLASIIKSPQSAVFSLFPLPCPHPHLPQLFLLLTSELFELYVRYLGQRKYRSVKKYWMTIAWPWLEVMTVASINKRCFFCTTKWQLLTQSLQNLIATFSSHAYYWNIFWRNCVKNCTLGFFKQFYCDFLRSKLSLTYRRNGWSDWCEMKMMCIIWILGELCDLDLWPHPWPWPCIFQGQISK